MNALSEIKIENRENLGAVVSSRVVAEELGKRHSDIINQIGKLLENENVRSLIIPNQYQVQGQNRKYKEYLLTKDGFTLYMFNVQGHNDFKMAYIKRFNEMENHIQNNLIGAANEIIDNPQVIQLIAEQVAHINKNQQESNQETHNKLDSLNSKFEGEYVTPQDLVALKYAINHKAEQVIERHGLQMTLDTIADDPTVNIFEQAEAHKKQKEQYQYHLGKVKSRILVMVKKALGLKGNAPNNHIKRKDVDRVIQYVKDLRPGAVN